MQDQQTEVSFFPVLHLLTGPPGLARNGGIWKILKRGLSAIASPPRLMVQATHFASYQLSEAAWTEWFRPGPSGCVLAQEVAAAFGGQRDVFVDSGGFQLLHTNKLDLSEWGLKVRAEDIYGLQTKYGAQRVASLDSPIHPSCSPADVSRLTRMSVRNAVWLAEHSPDSSKSPIPYLAVHGRNPVELDRYFTRLESALPRGYLKRARHGVALGSQVPLTRTPGLILENIKQTLRWMQEADSPETPLHLFGVGDAIVGSVARSLDPSRPISYDNSTYVQKAFRLRMYDPTLKVYREFNPHLLPTCECPACEALWAHGPEFVSELLARPAYRPSSLEGRQVNRSDIMALIALHNLGHWQMRTQASAVWGENVPHESGTVDRSVSSRRYESYQFPLREFEPRAETLLLLPCSKGRPYKESSSHRRVVSHLSSDGFEEGSDFDRITLSGLYGPVHWDHELYPAIMTYDFQLGPMVSRSHLDFLQVRTATVLSVLRRKYTTIIAYLPSKVYATAFSGLARSFSASVVDSPHQICSRMQQAS